jgi:hypothetical protein
MNNDCQLIPVPFSMHTTYIEQLDPCSGCLSWELVHLALDGATRPYRNGHRPKKYSEFD